MPVRLHQLCVPKLPVLSGLPIFPHGGWKGFQTGVRAGGSLLEGLALADCGPQQVIGLSQPRRRPSKDYQPHRLVRAPSAAIKTQENQLFQKEERSGWPQEQWDPGTQMPQDTLSPSSISILCASLSIHFILPFSGFQEDEILARGISGLYLSKLVSKKD